MRCVVLPALPALPPSQDSTPLWELMPAAMDQAVRMHNEAIRSLAQRHLGYEACTEGDRCARGCPTWLTEHGLLLYLADIIRALLRS